MNQQHFKRSARCVPLAECPGDVHWNGLQWWLHLLMDQLHRVEYQVWNDRCLTSTGFESFQSLDLLVLGPVEVFLSKWSDHKLCNYNKIYFNAIAFKVWLLRLPFWCCHGNTPWRSEIKLKWNSAEFSLFWWYHWAARASLKGPNTLNTVTRL